MRAPRPTRGLAAVLLSGLLLGPLTASGSTPIVRVSVDPGRVLVGQAAKVTITVLVPTWLSRPSVYPGFELPNALTRLPPDSSYPFSEQVEGESWSGVAREYDIYPQIAARYVIAGESIRVAYADPETRKPVEVDVPVPTIEWEGQVPAGAEALRPFLAGTAAELVSSLEGDTATLEPGAAVTRKVTLTLSGMPAMFLPPLQSEAPVGSGVTAYPRSPVVEDRANGTAVRTEQVTYVFAEPGRFELPPIQVRWWNVKTSRIESVSVPASPVAIAGASDDSAANEREAEASPWRARAVSMALGIVALVGVTGLALPKIVRWSRRRRAAWRASEGFAIGRVRGVITKGSTEDVERTVLTWLASWHPGTTFASLSRITGDDRLERLMAGLSADRHGGRAAASTLAPADRRELLQAFDAAVEALAAPADRAPGQLTALNP